MLDQGRVIPILKGIFIYKMQIQGYFGGQNWPKNKNISNCKNKSVIVFYMDRETKLSTVTSSSDLPFRGQRSKKVKT